MVDNIGQDTIVVASNNNELSQVTLSVYVRPDDDRIVSHDAPRLGLYYHCVRDVIIYSTLSRRNHGVLSDLSEFRGFCFQEYRFSLFSLRFQGEFCRYSEGFYLCFVGLSWSTYKLCGKHGRTKKSSHPCGCCEFARDRILISGLTKPSLSFSRGTFSEEKLRGFLIFLLTSLVRFLAGLFGVVPLATWHLFEDDGSIELLKFTKLNTPLLRLVITAEHFAVSERIITKTPSKIIILTLKDDQARE